MAPDFAFEDEVTRRVDDRCPVCRRNTFGSDHACATVSFLGWPDWMVDAYLVGIGEAHA